ncbi:S8 family serine peptidase, partial [Candidatus Pacearchaeota archaeon]|nr:S8 family serine peptidase [Candidatus Pacearchaeota archaeon]
RGWGDIGYNFLVDSNGNIYEGRYGGDGVAGAHAKGYNVGSVGVGVLGDFRYISPNKKVRNGLHKIAVWKFYTHNVDPDKATNFGSPLKTLPSVFYHGQVSNTACAGTYLNNFTPSLKKLAHYMPQQIVLKDSSGINRIVGSSSQTVSDLLAAYKNKGVVAPNYIRKIAAFPDDGVTPPNDTNYSSQWDLPKLEALKVWKESTGGSSSIKVAVVDTGVAYEDYNPPGSENYAKGPDFASTNFVAGYDYVNNDAHPNDDDGHGTVVASMIAESTNNSIGSASLAYNVSIMPIKVCDSDGWCLDSEVAKGIKFARTNGAKVINMSIGGDDYSSVVQSTINLAWDFGIVTVASSGNDGINKLSYPARGFRVLGVGALTNSDSRASYSNYGYRLDLVAPGGNGLGSSGDLLYQYVNCTVGLDCTSFEYARVAGTSMSSPLVSAAAALIFSKDADIGNAEAVDALIKNTQDLGSSGYDSQF